MVKVVISRPKLTVAQKSWWVKNLAVRLLAKKPRA